MVQHDRKNHSRPELTGNRRSELKAIEKISHDELDYSDLPGMTDEE